MVRRAISEMTVRQDALSGTENVQRLVLDEESAAEQLGLSPRTLQRMRLDGNGPPYVVITATGRRVGYRLADLSAWLDARTVRNTAAATGLLRRLVG